MFWKHFDGDGSDKTAGLIFRSLSHSSHFKLSFSNNLDTVTDWPDPKITWKTIELSVQEIGQRRGRGGEGRTLPLLLYSFLSSLVWCDVCVSVTESVSCIVITGVILGSAQLTVETGGRRSLSFTETN